MTPTMSVILRGIVLLLVLIYLLARLVLALARGTITSPVGSISRHDEARGYWIMIGWSVLVIALAAIIGGILAIAPYSGGI